MFVATIGSRPLLAASWGILCAPLLGGCETIEQSEVATYVSTLDNLRNTTVAEDQDIGSQFAALTESGSRDPVAYLNLYRKLHASNTVLLLEMEKIKPPAGIRRHHADFVEGLHDLVTALDKVIAMIEAGNVISANREFQRAVTRSQAKQTGAMLNIRRVARSVGIRM